MPRRKNLLARVTIWGVTSRVMRNKRGLSFIECSLD